MTDVSLDKTLFLRWDRVEPFETVLKLDIFILEVN